MTVTTLAGLFWFLGFAALVILAVTATVHARARGQHLERRSGILVAAALTAGLGFAGAWAWSAGPAVEGAERRAREGIAVELAVEQLTAPLPPSSALLVGFTEESNRGDAAPNAAHATSAPTKGKRARRLLPGRGPAEVVQVEQTGDGARWRFTAMPGVALAVLPATSSSSPASSRSTGAASALRLPPLAQRRALAAACDARTNASPVELAVGAKSPPGFRLAAVICEAGTEWRAVLFGATPARAGAAAELSMVPLAGPRWLSPRLTAVAGSLLHLDGGAAQLPGLRSWNVGGAGAGWVLAIPEDPRGCERWLDGIPASSGERIAAPPGSCRLAHAGTVVRATPLVPDVAGVRTRALAAAALIAGPAALLLLGLALARGSRRRTQLVAPAVTLAVLGVALSAVLGWRLLWAHRIDLLREVSLAGWRVADNQLAAWLVGATIAGLCGALLAEHARRGRWISPIAAWLGWLVASGGALFGLSLLSGAHDRTGAALALPPLGTSALPLAVASLAVALAPELLRRLWAMPARARLGAAHALACLALAAVAGKILAPKLVLLKLAIAYAIVVAGHAALTSALSAATLPSRRLIAVIATAAAALAMLAFDGGVSLAITFVGLLGAMVMAGHDAMYGEAAAARLGLLEREHARILGAYGVAAACLAVALVGWGLVASDRLLIEHTADLLLHIPLAVAGLFALGALMARRHGQPTAAWLAAGLAALALWGARQPALERVMAGDGVSAHRVSAVVDPGYALLRDERRFMAQTSAWQAATLPEAAALDDDEGEGSAAARWQGQGLAGARVADPGVARSIDNDYLPILIARELGVAGLVRTTLLLLGCLLAVGALAGARLPHASAVGRVRSLVLFVAGALCIYQPLAALGILPLTGISWPGLGVDSPADLWVACFGLVWCLFGGLGPAPTRATSVAEPASVDERVRAAPRLRRARMVIAVAMGAAGVAGVAMVARAGDSALGRGGVHKGVGAGGDPRVDRAIAYARSLRCGDAKGASLPELGGAPGDETTARFHLELMAAWQSQRALLESKLLPATTAAATSTDAPRVATSDDASADEEVSDDKAEPKAAPKAKSKTEPKATKAMPEATPNVATVEEPALLASCKGRLQKWRLEREGDLCRATFDGGWPQIRVELRPQRDAVVASCRVDIPGDPIAQLAPRPAASRQRVRLVSRAMGDAASDVGELLVGKSIIRLRPGAPVISLDALPGDDAATDTSHSSDDGPVLRFASKVQLGETSTIEIDGDVVRLRGRAQTWTSTAASAESPSAWVRTAMKPKWIPASSPAKPAPNAKDQTAAAPDGKAPALDDATTAAANAPSPAAPDGTPDTDDATANAATDLATAPDLATALAAAAKPAKKGDKAQPDAPVAPPTLVLPQLDRITLLVGDGPAPRTALFRPRRGWDPAALTASAAPTTSSNATPSAPAKTSAAATSTAPRTVDPLLADDVLAVSDRPRRAYPFGPALPVLGWVNPYAVDRSLGLDGWVHAAIARKPALASAAALDAASPAPTCGLLDPPAIPRDAVCSPSPLDGVLECRVSLQPELTLALAQKLTAVLTEPAPLTGRPIPALRAAAVLLRGDTGEILAQSDTTWGRAPSAYAPRTAADELALIRLREDRDPKTGEPGEPGESEAERVDWNQPIAVGSTLKPVMARAAELTFPEVTPELLLGFSGGPPQCKGRRGAGFGAILGHCPPTSLAGEPLTSDLRDFLSRSPNWYQAALGLIGLGYPGGNYATGDQSRSLFELVSTDLSAWPTAEPLVVRDADGPILGKRGVVLAGLRRTPLWQNVERVLGRPLCTLGDRKSCVVAASRRDVCAARALPLPDAGADLRHLVALGPDRFDFYGDNRPRQTTVPTREYLQWLRGSGAHPVGSLSQLTDSFARVIYEAESPTAQSTAAPRLAASWFPAPSAGALPSWRCERTSGAAAKVRGADGGLCAVIAEGGTAHRAVASLFADPRLTLYGAKTGTIDSLAGIARNRKSCEAWNRRHTLADRPLVLASQPGWLDCGKATPDDSLFVVSFSVATPDGPVPLTLGLALQRSGKGAAARMAPHLVSLIADYFDASR